MFEFWRRYRAATSRKKSYQLLLERLEFRDEPRFHEECATYLKWVEITTKAVAKNADDFVSDPHFCASVISENSGKSASLASCFTDSNPFSSLWTYIAWEPKPALFGGRGFIKQAFHYAVHSNRQLLEFMQRHVASEEYKTRKVKVARREALLSKKIFIVHGHDHVSRDMAVDFLTQLGFLPVVLHNEANQGRTVIEKFEAHADVGFAVVLLTPDDRGGSRAEVAEGKLNGRARQNVILELGYFIARLGRDRVCALREGNVEMPSDILGVVFLPLDDQGAWKIELSKELMAAGYVLDLNLLARSRAKA
jgi:predicted nucleotide-binding protein